jgi:hypothetical protein
MLPTNKKEFNDHLSNIDIELKAIANAITQNRESIKKLMMIYLNIIKNYMK